MSFKMFACEIFCFPSSKNWFISLIAASTAINTHILGKNKETKIAVITIHKNEGIIKFEKSLRGVK